MYLFQNNLLFIHDSSESISKTLCAYQHILTFNSVKL